MNEPMKVMVMYHEIIRTLLICVIALLHSVQYSPICENWLLTFRMDVRRDEIITY